MKYEKAIKLKSGDKVTLRNYEGEFLIIRPCKTRSTRISFWIDTPQGKTIINSRQIKDVAEEAGT